MSLMQKINGLWNRNGNGKHDNDEIKVEFTVEDLDEATESQLETQTRQHKWYEMPTFKRWAFTDKKPTKWYEKPLFKLEVGSIGETLEKVKDFALQDTPQNPKWYEKPLISIEVGSFHDTAEKIKEFAFTKEQPTKWYNKALFTIEAGSLKDTVKKIVTQGISYATEPVDETKLWYPAETAAAIGKIIKSFWNALIYTKETVEVMNYETLDKQLKEKMKEAEIKEINTESDYIEQKGISSQTYNLALSQKKLLDDIVRAKVEILESEDSSGQLYFTDFVTAVPTNGTARHDQNNVVPISNTSYEQLELPVNRPRKLRIRRSKKPGLASEANKFDAVPEQSHTKKDVLINMDQNPEGLYNELINDGQAIYTRSSQLLAKEINDLYTLANDTQYKANAPKWLLQMKSTLWLDKSKDGKVTGVNLTKQQKSRDLADDWIEAASEYARKIGRDDLAVRLESHYNVINQWSLYERISTQNSYSTVNNRTEIPLLEGLLSTKVSLPGSIVEKYEKFKELQMDYMKEKVA